MQLNGVHANSSATEVQRGGTGAPETNLDYNAFLQLLIAQLKNQDPTRPMDSAQYIAQLAGFSNVEQSVKLNAKIDTLVAGQSIAQANSLIGKTVTSSDGSVRGEVKSVHIMDTGMTAELVGGKTVELGTGITVE